MWFLYKLIGAAIAFLVRMKGRYLFAKQKDQFEVLNGVQFLMTPIKGKHNAVLGTLYEFPFACQMVFKLTEETALDTFFKSLGMANELQTEHHEFDWNVYVASDSSTFKAELKANTKLRELVLKILRQDCKHIVCDGSILEFRFSNDSMEHPVGSETQKLCFELVKEMSALCQKPVRRLLDDRFASRILLVEAAVWSLAVYAFSNFFQMQLHDSEIFLDFTPVFVQGFLVGAGIGCLLFLAIALFLRGSSRAHRILIESFLLLVLSIPVGGISLVADVNIYFDRAPPLLVEGTVTQHYVRSHRRRKGGIYYTYHIQYKPLSEPQDFSLPLEITVSSEIYGNLRVDKPIAIEIGRGFLKHPWYRSISPDKTW